MTLDITLEEYNTPWNDEQLREDRELPSRKAEDEPDGVFRCEECNEPILHGELGTPIDYIYRSAWENCKCPGSRANWKARSAGKKRRQAESDAAIKAKKDKEDDERRQWEVEWARRRAAEAAKDAKEEELREKRQEVEERELNRRLEQADRYDLRVDEDDDTEPEGSTLADFTATWDDKLDLSPLPALLKAG